LQFLQIDLTALHNALEQSHGQTLPHPASS
jgi:hypothetical protein